MRLMAYYRMRLWFIIEIYDCAIQIKSNFEKIYSSRNRRNQAGKIDFISIKKSFSKLRIFYQKFLNCENVYFRRCLIFF